MSRVSLGATVALAAGLLGANEAPGARTLRYTLVPGDHVTYSESFTRTVRGAASSASTQASWQTHVLVTGVERGLLAIGFQRRLVSDPDGGRHESRFAEANLFDRLGRAAGPWVAARETHSEVLPGLHEIDVLPQEPVVPGDSWTAPSLLGLTYRLDRLPKGEDASCAAVLGKSADGRIRTRALHCDGLGPLRLEMEATYAGIRGEITEHVVFERTAVRRGEEVAAWLADEELALGVRAAADRAPGLRLVPATAPEPPPPASRCAAATRPAEIVGTTLRSMQAPGFEGWPYVLHVPRGYAGTRPFPLLVYLGGGPGRALMALATARPLLREQPWLVVVPHAQGLWWHDGSVRMLDALLAEVLAQLNVDRDRVYLAGFSNGATGAWRAAARHPGLFASVSLLMGAGPAIPDNLPPTANLSGQRLLLLHGADDAVIPAAIHRRSVKELRDHAVDVVVDEAVLPGRAHDLTLASDDGRSVAFFEAHPREAFPARVRLATSRPARRSWIEVTEMGGGRAEVDATLEGSVARVRAKGARRVRLLLRRELVPDGTTLIVELNGREAWRGVVVEDEALLARTCATEADPARAYATVVELAVP